MLETKLVNFESEEDCQAFLKLMNTYAEDEAGGGTTLPETVTKNLVNEIKSFKNVLSIFLIQDSNKIGLANCIWSFSTFSARKILNLHDLIILKDFRGSGLGSVLLQEMERIAISENACKLTLEVLASNSKATKLYSKFGFEPYVLDPKFGPAQFWQKKLV